MRATYYLLVSLAACGDDIHPTADAGGDPDGPDIDAMTDAANDMPATLAGTGLCTDAGCATVNADIIAFAPQFPLWSDGATKRRWMKLPAGEKIDTSDMNYWKFPIGTKLWKEFTRDGVRCETRYIVKVHDEADVSSPPWFYVSYKWNLAQNDTVQVSQGEQNVNGTGHDIPARAQCRQCHDGLRGPNHDRGRVLGFQAIQLDFTSVNANDLTLQKLVDQSLLTDNPPSPGTVGAPFYPLTFTTAETAAFGYVHANCAHCHNPSSQTHDQVAMVLRLDTTMLATAMTTPTYTSTVGVDAERAYPALPDNASIVAPNDPTNSVMIGRMNNPDFSYHMPQAGSEIVDPTGQTILTTWINALP